MADVPARTELKVTTGPIRGSRKIHVEGRDGVRVAMRTVDTQRQCRHVAFDGGATFYRVDPERREPALSIGACLPRTLEDGSPRIGLANSQAFLTDLAGDVLAHRMSLVAVNAPLALLQVNGIAGKVPVDDSVAVGVEVEALLADGRRGEEKQ